MGKQLCNLPSAAQAAQSYPRFRDASPFPHLIWTDSVGVEPDEVADAFAAVPNAAWNRFEDSYQFKKQTCNDIAAMPELLADIIRELSEPAFLEVLEAATGIIGLVPDPYLEGGGLHLTGGGGTLSVHTDFHVYNRLRLFRRINLILYLNGTWTDRTSGGELQLCDPDDDRPVMEVVPSFGTCVVFETTDRSPHGFTNPVPDGCERRSIALYYYTAEDTTSYGGDTNTYWRTHESSGRGDTARLVVYKGLLFVSRAFSWLAHKANPRLGWRRR